MSKVPRIRHGPYALTRICNGCAESFMFTASFLRLVRMEKLQSRLGRGIEDG